MDAVRENLEAWQEKRRGRGAPLVKIVAAAIACYGIKPLSGAHKVSCSCGVEEEWDIRREAVDVERK
tara:strand:- start:649 stop:849 length:201 start_codon:yes stop_codon:yes gene_type:complete